MKSIALKRFAYAFLGVILIAYTSVTVAYNLGLNDTSNAARIAAATEAVADPITVDAVIAGINKERAEAGVPPVTHDARLDASAQYKSSDMDMRHYFAHEDPETGRKNGSDVLFELTDADDCGTMGENLAEGYHTTEQLVDAWMKSPGHRSILLNPDYKLTGVGISGKYVSQHFCGPKL